MIQGEQRLIYTLKNGMYIYTLTDPRNNQVRYIGKTNNLKLRYNRHIHDAKTPTSHKKSWLKGIIDSGGKPIMEVLDTYITEEEANSLEIFYIEIFKSWGFNLTNMTLGGDGVVPTAITRKKMSDSAKGKRTGLDNFKSKPIAQHHKDTGEVLSVYPSKLIAVKSIGCGKRTLDSYFDKTNHNPHGGGYDWKEITKEEYNNLVDELENGKFKYIPLVQKKTIIASKEGFSKKYTSVLAAAKELGLHNALISRCLNGRTMKTGGYSFQYA